MPDAPYGCPNHRPPVIRSAPPPVPKDFDEIIEDWRRRVMWYEAYSSYLDRKSGRWLFMAVLFAQIAILEAVHIARWPYWAYPAAITAVFLAFVGIASVLRPTQDDRDRWGR